MTLLRTAGILLISSSALALAVESKTVQQSGTKQDPQHDSTPKSLPASVSDPLQHVEDELLGVAQAMPDDKYSFIPTAGKFDDVRSFREQIKHVACAQFAFFNEFEGKEPPADCEKGGHDPAKTKTELIKYLRDSFAYSNRVLATLNAQNALKQTSSERKHWRARPWVR